MSFEKAVADSKKLTSKPSNEELLDLYGTPGPGRPASADGHPTDSIAALFKIANGEDISSAPAPGMFDLKVRPPGPVAGLLPDLSCGRHRTSSGTQLTAFSRRTGQGKEERVAEEG